MKEMKSHMVTGELYRPSLTLPLTSLSWNLEPEPGTNLLGWSSCFCLSSDPPLTLIPGPGV